MAISTSFQTQFAVPMTCQSCVDSIKSALDGMAGIENIEANIQDQLVTISGTAAPSKIVEAIEGTGRDAILRGSGGSESAAVCILESHSVSNTSQTVAGLARLVQPASALTLIDLTLHGLTPGTYYISVRAAGDISSGAISTGTIWNPSESSTPRGDWGTITVDKTGKGSVFFEREVDVWEIIGRGMVISRERADGGYKDNEGVLIGVVARSAGVWENVKAVCSCSGKTLWDERKEVVGKGML